MKIFKAATFATLMLASLTAQAGQPIINLSVGGELAPGVYGQVQFGNAPPPPVVYARPRVIVRELRGQVLEPMYMNVPPGHARNWRKHCHKYDACNRPVYFVRSQEYEPGYREGRGRGRGHRGDHHEGRGGHGDRGDHGDRGEHRGDNHEH